MRVDVADPNPSRSVNGLPSPSNAEHRYVTHCKVCPYGVYKGQPWVWLNGRTGPVGITHEPCATGHGHTKAVTNHG